MDGVLFIIMTRFLAGWAVVILFLGLKYVIDGRGTFQRFLFCALEQADLIWNLSTSETLPALSDRTRFLLNMVVVLARVTFGIPCPAPWLPQ